MVDLKSLTPDIRRLSDMKEVLYDQEWARTAEDRDLYYMYRAIEQGPEIRYDITVIPAQMLGSEFTKTKGHDHVGGYQEVYTILEGEAIFFFQKDSNDDGIVEDVVAIKAKKGAFVTVPIGYAHITINPGDQDLKLANWMDKDVKSDYKPILERKGGSYFYTTDGWIKNTNYKSVPELRFAEPEKSLPKDLSFLED